MHNKIITFFSLKVITNAAASLILNPDRALVKPSHDLLNVGKVMVKSYFGQTQGKLPDFRPPEVTLINVFVILLVHSRATR